MGGVAGGRGRGLVGGVASHAARCLSSGRRRFRVNSAGGGRPHPQARPRHGRPRRVPAQPSASFRRRRSSASGTRARYDERPQPGSGLRGRPGIPPDGAFGSAVPGEGGRGAALCSVGELWGGVGLLRALRSRRGAPGGSEAVWARRKRRCFLSVGPG